jgi:porphobilinogen synthase
MQFPESRLRRMRRTPALRRLVRETRLNADQLVQPLFVVPGRGIDRPVGSMPGVSQLSVDRAVEAAGRAQEAGCASVILFGIPPQKDAVGSASWRDDGIVQQAARALKRALPDLCVIADVCFCEYTSHGHCGVIEGGDVDNDRTLENLGQQAVSLVEAGVDVIAPSGMMDGMVRAIRANLDTVQQSHIPIMSYSVKYASAYYGPFRDAAESAPSFGDRRTYQMDPANAREAMREAELDVAEGADVLMVKPALAYLDLVRQLRDRFEQPIAAYNVSGELAMVEAAAQRGWVDRRRIILETLTSMRRAGADIILTYWATEVAQWLKAGNVDGQ